MNRDELTKSLDLVGQALAQQPIVPVFQCYCFTGHEVLAYNDTIAIVAPCLTEEQFAVNGKTLSGLLGATFCKTVEFSLEKNDLVIKAGTSNFKLPYFKPEEFLFDEPEDKWDFTVKGTNLVSGLMACLLTASRDQSQAALMGITILKGTKGVTLYSCNSDAMTRCGPPVTISTPYIVPVQFCEAVLKVNSALEEAFTLSLNNDWAMAEFENGHRVYGRMLTPSPNQPDYNLLVEQTLKSTPTYVPIPEELPGALARARVVADPESAKTVFTVRGNRLNLVTTTAMGVVKDAMAFKHEDVEANVSAALLARALPLTSTMAIMENCCAFKSEELFILCSNMG